jgi:hypothetical protein
MVSFVTFETIKFNLLLFETRGFNLLLLKLEDLIYTNPKL